MTDPTDNRAKYMHGLPRKVKLSWDQRIRRASRIIRDNVDTPHPVRVRTLKASEGEFKKLNALGYTYLANENKEKSKRYFVIAIPRSTPPDTVVELLIHEWAHTMAWYDSENGDHGRAWGRAYSCLYGLIIDD